MSAIAWLIEWFNWLSEYFYKLYLDVESWPWPFSYSAYLFYFFSYAFAEIAWQFYDFSFWVTDVTNKVRGILNWATIWNYIKASLPNIEAINLWFYNWMGHVFTAVNEWWAEIKQSVFGVIAELKSGFYTRLWELNLIFTSLQSEWDKFKGLIPSINEALTWLSNWWNNILANLNSWWGERLIEIQSLINSAFVIRNDLWRGWQDWRDKVTEFFTDPEDWLYKSVDRIIERFW